MPSAESLHWPVLRALQERPRSGGELVAVIPDRGDAGGGGLPDGERLYFATRDLARLGLVEFRVTSLHAPYPAWHITGQGLAELREQERYRQEQAPASWWQQNGLAQRVILRFVWWALARGR